MSLFYQVTGQYFFLLPLFLLPGETDRMATANVDLSSYDEEQVSTWTIQAD